jgi:hypothetical protein
MKCGSRNLTRMMSILTRPCANLPQRCELLGTDDLLDKSAEYDRFLGTMRRYV